MSTSSPPFSACLCPLILPPTSARRTETLWCRCREEKKSTHAQLPIVLRRHILVLLKPPRPRKVLHPQFLSLVDIHRPRLRHLEDGQHRCRDRPPCRGIIPETRDGACVVVVFNEDPVRNGRHGTMYMMDGEHDEEEPTPTRKRSASRTHHHQTHYTRPDGPTWSLPPLPVHLQFDGDCGSQPNRAAIHYDIRTSANASFPALASQWPPVIVAPTWTRT